MSSMSKKNLTIEKRKNDNKFWQNKDKIKDYYHMYLFCLIKRMDRT